MAATKINEGFKAWDQDHNSGPSIVNFFNVKATDPGAFSVGVATDGTNTIAEIVLADGATTTTVGRGLARRRKGDPRDPALGSALALQRAFADAARRYAETVEDYMSPQEDNYFDLLREMQRREQRDAVRAEKLARRKSARDAWEAKNGGPWKPNTTEGNIT